MNDTAPTYNSRSRMSDDDYSGVVRRIGSTVRVVVNPAGTRYAFHRRFEEEGEVVWIGSSYAKLSTLLAKQAASCDGLALACEGLPDSPAAALPDLRKQHADIVAAFAANDWRRDDYARVVCSDGNLRLCVDPTGTEYRLQWISIPDRQAARPTDNWKSIKISPDIEAIKSHFRLYVGDASNPDFYDPQSEYSDKSKVAPLLQAAFASVPVRAEDGLWPDLPERPETKED